jgi:serine/threonine protein phosphatase PrpC
MERPAELAPPNGAEQPASLAAPSDAAQCPGCGNTVASGDVFCESCGAVLDHVAALEVAHSAETRTDEAARATLCVECAGLIDDTGYCSLCGAKARVWRDHFSESADDVAVAGVCDRGVRHHRNEDGMALGTAGPWSGSDDTAAVLLAVCDGVTTAPRSDEVSLSAARIAIAQLRECGSPPGSRAGAITFWSDALTNAGRAAQRETVAQARAMGDPAEPPSCTFVAAVAHAGLAIVAWCGDSRAYWIADRVEAAVRLTVDHSLAAEMIRSGIAPDIAEADPTAHTITRWFGADTASAECDIATAELSEPGWLLVCSDGLWNYASAPAALHALIHGAGAATPMAVAEHLVAWANGQGGHDNITALVARIQPHKPTPKDPA